MNKIKNFVQFTNRDLKSLQLVAIDRIISIGECQHPEHSGYALLIIDCPINSNHEPLIIEADMSVEEFSVLLAKSVEP